ncbi:MAG TPA: AAA family ATPase [Blastocatellia bacterium]
MIDFSKERRKSRAKQSVMAVGRTGLQPSVRTSTNFITRISVDKLFGAFTYDLHLPDGSVALKHNDPPLMILYGDNGSGKTTLLKLVFGLLSPRQDKTQLDFIKKTPFERLVVELSDGTAFGAERSGRTTGSCIVYTQRPGQRRNWFIIVDKERGGEPSSPSQIVESPPKTVGEYRKRADERAAAEAYAEFLEFVSALDLRLSFLGDDRKAPENPNRQVATGVLSNYNPISYNQAVSEFGNGGTLPIGNAVNRFGELIKQQALSGSSEGEESSNLVYAHIAELIARPTFAPGANPVPRRDSLRADLEELAKRSETFSTLGLAPRLNVDGLVASLAIDDKERLNVWLEVLEPYVAGVKVRLDALEATRRSVQTFLSNVNSFYTNKHVEFNVSRGLSVLTEGGEPLPLDRLSSGETQLLLLFCNVLTAPERGYIFIIDEPELSLNVKWQRRLVKALLDCAEGRSVQFILATHSIELLARHRHNVVELAQTEEEKGTLKAARS